MALDSPNVMNLASKFNTHDLGGISFHEVLGNDELNDLLALKRNGILHDDTAEIDQFWRDNSGEVDRLKAVYSDLKTYQKDVEG